MNLENKQFGNYKFVKLIGRGGMAEVWLAEQMNLGRQVAIKVMTEVDNASRQGERFSREAQILAQLDHPSILPIIDYGQTEGFYYLVMPYVRGGSLQKRFEEAELTPAEIFKLFPKLLAGLDYAHRRGIIHRDLKPGNILLYPDGRAVIADFGIAKLQSEEVNLTKTGLLIGSPEYMAPEQFRGRPDYRSDLYALGIMLFELLTGHPPYTGATAVEVGMRHLSEPVPLPHPLIPAPLEAFLLKALEKNPAERFSSVSEMERAFQAASVALSAEAVEEQAGWVALEPALVSSTIASSDRATFGGIASDSPPPNVIVMPEPTGSGQFQALSQGVTGGFSARISSAGYSPAPASPGPKFQKPGRSNRLVALVVGLVILLGLAAGLLVTLSGNSRPVADSLSQVPGSPQGQLAETSATSPRQSLTFPIVEANGTQVKGTGIINDNGNGSVDVILKISGLEPGSHMTHIHQGSCQGQGQIKYPLTNLEATSAGEAISSTTVQVDFATLTRGDMYVNVHNAVGTPTYVAACGIISS